MEKKPLEQIDVREFRVTDFKNMYALGLTMCLGAQDKANESMIRAHKSSIIANESALKVLAAEKNISDILNSIDVMLRGRANRLYETQFVVQADKHSNQLKVALFKISEDLAMGLLRNTNAQAKNILSEVGNEFRVHLSSVDKFDTRLNGKSGVAERLNSRLESDTGAVLGLVEERLLGTNGIATKTAHKLLASTNHLLAAMKATIAASQGLQKVLNDSRRTFWIHTGFFGSGLLIGGLFVRIFR